MSARRFRTLLLNLGVAFIALLVLFPLAWMVSVSFMSTGEAATFPPPLLPNWRLARLTPTAIVSTTRPSLKPKSAIPTVGPWSDSGPSSIVPSVAVSPAWPGLMVNVSRRSTLSPPSTVRKLPARKVTVTWPVVKGLVVGAGGPAGTPPAGTIGLLTRR